MSFQFIVTRIGSIQIAMIKVGEEHYITQQGLEKLLGVSKEAIYHTFKARRSEFDGLRVNTIHLKDQAGATARDFIKENKELLGVKRVRDDMHLWSENDMLTFTMLIRGPKGKELRRDLIQFIKDNAARETVSLAEYEECQEINGSLRSRIAALEEEMRMLRPVLEEWAKISSKSLRAQRETKRLRESN